jgi:RimJ/RimL family protein N-acetyltransferase
VNPDSPAFTLRPAAPGDLDLLREWRNDPATIAASASAAGVDADEHAAWFAAVLADPDRHLWIAQSDRPLGQVRFDRTRGYVYEVSVSLDPEARGQGLGRELIAGGSARLFAETHASSIVARVRPENSASQSAFRAVGFKPVGKAEDLDLLELRRPDEWAPALRSAGPRN